MSKSNKLPNNIHVLLIGVDFYFPNKMPDNGGSYPSLGGCVRDVNYVEDFLIKNVGIPQSNILKLTASKDGRDNSSGGGIGSPQQLLEPKEKWPSYENMVSAFNQITDKAKAGDQIYIHYSGHGGRAKTAYPELKKHTGGGLDEALVPIDIGFSEARYLRDVELAYLLKKMEDKGLVVTIVLDSCHSGGATRAAFGTVTRGTGRVDKSERRTDSLVASYEELTKAWEVITGSGDEGGDGSRGNNDGRGLSSSSSPSTLGPRSVQQADNGWLPEPKGYVLIAACEPNQSAYETVFETESRGALTYWLLDSLKHKGPNFTYRMLHDQITPKIHGQFPLQTPMLQGDRDRVVLEIDSLRPSLFAVNILGYDGASNRVKLNAGKVHGIGKGARFEVYPAGTIDFTKTDKRIAAVKVIDAGATESWAEIAERFSKGQGAAVIIEQGAKALLVDVASARLMRKVSLRFQEDSNKPLTADQKEGLERVKRSLDQLENQGLIVLASQGESSDYQVAIESDKGEEYEILDPAGKKIPNINPPLKISDPDAPDKIVKRLIHLAKYSNIQQLDNHDNESPLARKLDLKLFRLQPDYESGDKPELHPLGNNGGNTYTIDVGQYFLLRVHNLSNQVLKVAALDLQPDWGVSQIFPRASDTDYLNIDPGHHEDRTLRAYLPEGYQEGKDIIKAFATVGATSFRWLELAPLDQPTTRSKMTRAAGMNELEQFMAAMTEDKPKTRHLELSVSASHEWTTSQVEIKIQRNNLKIT
jgi:hypothetical protein